MQKITSLLRPVGALWLIALIALLSACGGDAEAGGIRAVPVADAAAVFEDQPAELVILDVRTPEEFEDGHLEGAIMIDFYEADFAQRLADLDRDKPYLLYCRSGNRSGSAAQIMDSLGFTDVADVDGGINAWTAAGQPVVN